MYGLGEQRVGSVHGWPLFIGAMILSSSAAGVLTGEWRSVRLRGKLVLCGGSLFIFLALIVVRWHTMRNAMETGRMKTSARRPAKAPKGKKSRPD
jgi:hypothetical protein